MLTASLTFVLTSFLSTLAQSSGTEVSSLRLAVDANRHAITAVAGGYVAHNPGQRWTSSFDGRGLSTSPDGVAWQWGLELERYGWGEPRANASAPIDVCAHGQRLAYTWDDTLTEWYVNDARGLEHGFTVRERPEGAQGELGIELAIRGGLMPVVSEDGRDVRFADASGFVVLNYAGLTVFDAHGRDVEARWSALGARLVLEVEDSGASYPLTIDPLAQQAYLKAFSTDAFDEFGRSVAIDGDIAVVGAASEDSSASGVNGNHSDDSAPDAGAAYVFVRTGSSWAPHAYLKASNAQAGDRFGTSVAISGETIVVGAAAEDSSATGVNGNQSDNSTLASGAVYVFVRTGTTWTQQAYLKASNTDSGDFFGSDVSIDDDTIVVGAPAERSNATGVNGDQSNDDFQQAGAAYVFTRDGGSWTQQAYLKASNTGSNDQFGSSSAIDGETLVIGAYHEESSATGVNGDQSNNDLSRAGAAYVFVRTGSAWQQQAYLKASNTGLLDVFGESVAVSGDTIAIGAFGEASNATGVNGNQSDDSMPDAGAVYIFVRSGSNWSQQAYVKSPIPGESDAFGGNVAIETDVLIVGCSGEDSGATGVNGNQESNSLSNSGAVYVFVRSGTDWIQQAFVKASTPGAMDAFGTAVDISGETMLAGARFEDSSATSVGGNQLDDSVPSAGAAYVFERLCTSLAPSSQVARLGTPPNPNVLVPSTYYPPVIGSKWDPAVDHTSFLPGALVDVLAISGAPANLPTGLGTILCDVGVPPILKVKAASVPRFAIAVPANCALVGMSLCSQAGSSDGVFTSLTNALDITLGTY